MGTNYYRYPKKIDERRGHELRECLNEALASLDAGDVSGLLFAAVRIRESLEYECSDLRVHIGKQSMGWKFLCRYHDGKHYQNAEELFAFIRSGIIRNEYGDLVDAEELISRIQNPVEGAREHRNLRSFASSEGYMWEGGLDWCMTPFS